MAVFQVAKAVGIECTHCRVTFPEHAPHPDNGCHMSGKTLHDKANDHYPNYRTAVRYEEREVL